MLPNHTIEFLSTEWTVNTLLFTFAIFLFLWVSKKSAPAKRPATLRVLSLLLILSILYTHARDVYYGHWSLSYSLPLHLCGISSLICCVFPFVPGKKALFQFVYYTGILGGLVSVLTPQINHYDGSLFVYIQYYFSHGLIVLIPLYIYLYTDIKLSRFSWLHTLLILNLLMLFIMPLDFAIGANYMYLAAPPEVANPLIIGDWPYYLIYLEFFVGLLSYALYHLSNRLYSAFAPNTTVASPLA